LALNPNFWIIRAYFLDASRESSSDFAPVTTIFPDAKIKPVVFGSRILMITAANRYHQPPALDARKPWDYIRRYAREEQWSSDQADNQD
jgi:hypothetical protein